MNISILKKLPKKQYVEIQIATKEANKQIK